MKKNEIFLIFIVLFHVNFLLNAQISTPSGVIQSSSGNNNIGIGFSGSPIAPLTIAKGDNTFGSLNRVSIALTYNNSGEYRHFITTRHEANRADYNAIEFYTCDGTRYGTFPSNVVHGLTIMNGKVGIATGKGVNPQNDLDVNGKIRANEIIVETGWADFVFHSSYNLRPLQEVNNYIQQNGHLPEIPTAKEVEENGVSLGEMNVKLLQKIEELTLYSIGQQKQIDQLLKTVEKQSSEIEKLKTKKY